MTTAILPRAFSERRPSGVPREAWRVRDGAATASPETIAAEAPIALVYNGVNHAVMMATPADLEDFGVGFSLAEAIVGDAGEVRDVEVADMVFGLEVSITIPEPLAAALAERQRSMVGGTACGMCGIIGLEKAMRPLPPTRSELVVTPQAVERALDALPGLQALNHRTRSVHAAGFADPDGTILHLREDVGRHNALDKLIGALARANVDPASGFLVLTSRCSTEMVQKAVTAGLPMLVAISAPTSLALELADEAGLTLVAFARGDGFTLYTHPQRVTAA